MKVLNIVQCVPNQPMKVEKWTYTDKVYEAQELITKRRLTIGMRQGNKDILKAMYTQKFRECKKLGIVVKFFYTEEPMPSA